MQQMLFPKKRAYLESLTETYKISAFDATTNQKKFNLSGDRDGMEDKDCFECGHHVLCY